MTILTKTMTDRKAYPMLLKPVPREIIWGGDNLKTKYGKEAPFQKIAESWELTVREDAVSLISNGEYAGMSLSEYLGDESNPFPLLIKFIDAGDRLSVQVHPDDSVTDNAGKPLGKTEMWYIIDADEGAGIVYGLKDGVTADEFARSVRNGDAEKYLSFVKVNKGDVFFIPSGQVHAIGKGITLAEIQQNSDTTYRIYDYHRTDKNGKERPLHIEEALKVIKIRTDEEISDIRFSRGTLSNCIANCDKFTSFLYEVNGEKITGFENFGALICVDGQGIVRHGGNEYPIVAGDTYFIPNGCGEFTVSGNLKILTAE